MYTECVGIEREMGKNDKESKRVCGRKAVASAVRVA